MPYVVHVYLCMDKFGFYHFWFFCDSHFWYSHIDAICGILVYAIFGQVQVLPFLALL